MDNENHDYSFYLISITIILTLLVFRTGKMEKLLEKQIEQNKQIIEQLQIKGN